MVIDFMRCSIATHLVVLSIVFGSLTTQTHAGLIVSIEAPGVQVTSVPGATTETFDSGAPTGVLGNYTNMLVLSPTVFSGVLGGAFNTNYAAAFDGLAVLELNSPQKYFGTWWAAADADNQIIFFDGANFLGSYLLTDFNGVIGPGHFGNPNNGLNVVDPYFYAHFTATGTTNITHVFFSSSSNSFFETDNHSVYDQPIAPPGTVVVPEPSSLVGMATIIGSVAMRRKRRSQPALSN